MNYKFWYLSPLLALVFSVPNAIAAEPEATVAIGDRLDAAENYGVFSPMTDSLDADADATALNQINDVSQLRDIDTSNWAFLSLKNLVERYIKNLVERYNCLAGYPNGTFRGDHPMSRYEFAAGLNACLEQISLALIIFESDQIDSSDMAAIARLTKEFEDELTRLNVAVDNLGDRTSSLEAHQFSTTTKLFGQTVFGI